MEAKLVMLAVLVAAVLYCMPETESYAQKLQIVTELGNSFAVQETRQQADSDIGNINAMIRVVGQQGTMIHGKGTMGKQSSLVPYVDLDFSDDFVSVILDSDGAITMQIPEFAKEYRYDTPTRALNEVQKTIPNILSYSESAILSGTGTINHDESEGISFEGPEKFVHKHNTRWWWKKTSHLHNVDVMAVKLDADHLDGSKTLLRGTVNGDYIKIAESPTDLTKISYSSNGYKVLESGESPDKKKVNKGFLHIHGKCCKGRHWHDQSYWVYSIDTNIWASSKDSVSANFHWPKFCSADYRWGCGHWSGPGTIPLDVHGSKRGDFFHITKLSFNIRYPSTINYGNGGTWHVTDKQGPFNTIRTFEDDFETTFSFDSNHPLYLLAQPDGRSTIKAETFDPEFGVWFDVSGLPPNTPFQIEKNGLVGASGMTQDNGRIYLTASSFDIGIRDTSKGGTLKIFPDSARFRGQLEPLTVFDTVNNQTLHIDDARDTKTSYVPFAYLQVPFAANTTLDKVTVMGDQKTIADLNFLATKYQAGSKVNIPILPGMTKAVLISQETENVVNLEDVAKSVSAKAIPARESSTSKYSANGAVSKIDANAAGGTFAIATGKGSMYSLVTMSVSGDSAFTNDVTLYFVPDQPPPPRPKDPLSVFVDVYKNGQLTKSERIYYDDKPNFTPVSELNGLDLKQAITYHYNQRTATSMVTVDVNPGDMVEFYARVYIHADGIPVDIPQISGGTYAVDKVVSAASATARIHSGSILTGMS